MERSSASSKQELFERLAAVARAFAHGHRLELIELIAQAERCVEELAGRCGLSLANTSQHLQQLRRSGVIAARRQGKRVFYRLADPAVSALVAALGRLAERRNAEVQRIVAGYLRERDALTPLSREELLRRMRRGRVTLIDVRPPEEFAAGHIPGALNVPLNELRRRLGRLPRAKEIVAYCRGPYCVLAYEAVGILRGRGFKARRLEDGYPEWRAAGFAVAAPVAGAH
jgi:ArsR family transcriptional regulator